MKPLERIYAAGIVILLITCGIMYLDLRETQKQREYFHKQMQIAIRENWKHFCPTNSTP